uniref:Uncharacterized protein n=1 Tax=Pararge aegeria TaxID=116150 RepID=S4P3T8_9NEOP
MSKCFDVSDRVGPTRTKTNTYSLTQNKNCPGVMTCNVMPSTEQFKKILAMSNMMNILLSIPKKRKACLTGGKIIVQVLRISLANNVKLFYKISYIT